MSTVEPGSGTGNSGEEPAQPVWEDVTGRQPERDVPPPAESHPIPPARPQFVPANQPAPAASFVRPDGTPIPSGPPLETWQQGGQAQPGGPVFVQPGTGLPTGVATPGGPMFVQPPKGPSPVDEDRPWPWWLGPVAFLVALIGIIPAQLAVVAAIAGLTGSSFETAVDDYPHWLGVMQDASWIALVLLLPFFVVKYLRPEQLGLRKPPRPWLAVGVFAAAFGAFYLFSGLYAAALGLQENDNTMLQDTGFGDGVGRDIVFALLFTVAAPVAEELLFRGLLFRTLRDGLSKAWGPKGGLAGGAIISGFFFGAVHLGGGQDDFLPVLMALGVFLALAYHWSGTIYVPIALHAFNNAIATGFNSDPAADWIYGLIALGPVLAVATAYGIGKGVARWFPPEPRNPAHRPAEEHATL